MHPPVTQQPLFASQLPSSTQEMLSQDPSMTQFNSIPGQVPLTLTEKAKKLAEVLPHYELTRFISLLAIPLLVPLLIEGLHCHGAPVQPFSQEQAEVPVVGRNNESAIVTLVLIILLNLTR
ncbi:hypothetical protein K458DRAFT_382125 [Lentithecium fluviatile CBS 122367]|uniref:Uncharacterized protein n=1 Tax=Lentithecium fluviatile CBS 122367 TaxID=1168545 RepID=A0A6G1JK99_9PLEO|nr:hypothetical protein K458DRAFT_382125 [Lentithecium fluviatile CBS 122367]